MRDKKKFMLPINIMNILSNNYGEMDKEELIQTADCEDKEYVLETIKDLITAGYIADEGKSVSVIGSRVISRW
ncbi:MAG: hypothetical protein Q4C49_12935 [Bacillota bacterium]|nr:hypothetical protein [Bacillota bacterium]